MRYQFRATASSLAGLREVWNATHDTKNWAAEPKLADEKLRKCRICGAEMEHIAGSNVYICHGTIEVPAPTAEDPNAKKMKPCNNFALSKR